MNLIFIYTCTQLTDHIIIVGVLKTFHYVRAGIICYVDIEFSVSLSSKLFFLSFSCSRDNINIEINH